MRVSDARKMQSQNGSLVTAESKVGLSGRRPRGSGGRPGEEHTGVSESRPCREEAGTVGDQDWCSESTR